MSPDPKKKSSGLILKTVKRVNFKIILLLLALTPLVFLPIVALILVIFGLSRRKSLAIPVGYFIAIALLSAINIIVTMIVLYPFYVIFAAFLERLLIAAYDYIYSILAAAPTVTQQI